VRLSQAGRVGWRASAIAVEPVERPVPVARVLERFVAQTAHDGPVWPMAVVSAPRKAAAAGPAVPVSRGRLRPGAAEAAVCRAQLVQAPETVAPVKEVQAACGRPGAAAVLGAGPVAVWLAAAVVVQRAVLDRVCGAAPLREPVPVASPAVWVVSALPDAAAAPARVWSPEREPAFRPAPVSRAACLPVSSRVPARPAARGSCVRHLALSRLPPNCRRRSE